MDVPAPVGVRRVGAVGITVGLVPRTGALALTFAAESGVYFLRLLPVSGAFPDEVATVTVAVGEGCVRVEVTHRKGDGMPVLAACG
jgi:hypothetical protein